MKVSSIILFIVLSFPLTSKSQFNITFVSNNDTSQIIEVLDELTREKRFKKINFKIINYNSSSTDKRRVEKNGKTIEVFDFAKNCDFNFCERITNAIENDFSSSVYFYSKKGLGCIENIGIDELSLNSSFKKEYLINEIKERYSNYKNQKNSTSLYFNYYNPEDSTITPKISFNETNLTAQIGEEISLKPVFSSLPNEIVWTPNENLSCYNCNNPIFIGTSSANYFVKYVDENGCTSNTAEIFITVKSNCDSLKKISFPDIDDFMGSFIKPDNEIFKFEFLPIGEQGGGYKYDIPITRVCGNLFKIKILDLDDKEIVIFDKDLEEGVNNAKLIGKNQDSYLIFRINLLKYHNDLTLGAKIIIESYDNETKINSFTSPIVSFSGCKP